MSAGGDNAIWAVGARFPGVGDPLKLRLSKLRFWLDGHKKMVEQETNGT
jgi:hypothetical protein